MSDIITEISLLEINPDSEYLLLVSRFAGIDSRVLFDLIKARKWKFSVIFVDDIEGSVKFMEIPKDGH